ncbi:Gfo/Idh/MocA family protein [Nesterenkonia haasae]|uniref:Gfo/Idh/MocA family protein n=1 Tax=Nesterenkonia haasae TaxID=2587813 RepID=UPI0013919E61|nr:Gfo/Idh/MocA family oxidoreductase [Nesterenkonia haasae]NDK31122.1 Gfo/Idh/MocA family oxidoreductase [Nesterenkonia haasae]
MSSEHSPYRVAIIGTGGIATAHAVALADLPQQAELVAVVDIDADRAEQFAQRFSVPAVYTDAGAMLAAEELDLVNICTPPQTHGPLAIEVIRHGVAALVEKPTALSLREMDELAEAQARYEAPILTVFQHRFGAAGIRLRDFVQAEKLGRPLVATCETLWYRNDAYFEVPWRGRWDIEGGGPTMGHGIHQFDLMLSVLGPWVDISAFAARQSRPTDTEDVSVALARFENGALATVVNSVVSPRETSRLRFDFEYATVEVEHLYGYQDADWTFTAAPGHEHLAAEWGEATSDEVSSHRMQLSAIFQAFTNHTEPEVSLKEARRTLEFAAATYASAFRRETVSAGQIAGTDPFAQSMSGDLVPWAPMKAPAV